MFKKVIRDQFESTAKAKVDIDQLMKSTEAGLISADDVVNPRYLNERIIGAFDAIA